MNLVGSGASLAGKVIVVTGASSGVGYGLVRRLTQADGATVIAVGRRRVFRLESLAKQVGVERVQAVTADMAVRAQADALIADALARHGRIDGFIHAVNRELHLSALDVSDAEFDLSMQINVKSALYGVQALAPTLRRQCSGAIIIYNPTPVRTEEFAASEAVYTAAAHALSALTAGWERQLSPCGVAVREVAPAPAAESSAAHDLLLAGALYEAFDAPAFRPAPVFATQPVAETIVLRARGGLSLTQFSR